MAEGYRCLKAIKFNKAKQYSRESSQKGIENKEEIQKALKAWEYWQPLVQVGEKFSFAYEEDRFYIDDHTTGPDLLLKLNQFIKAEHVVLERIKKNPDDHRLKYFIAQIQWLTNKRGEAKKNYTWAFCIIPEISH